MPSAKQPRRARPGRKSTMPSAEQPHTTYQGPVRKLSEKWLRSAENGTRKIWRIYKVFLAEKENLPLGSEEQDAWVNAIMEEQAARSARSRRKVIEDFHCVCGW